jgi:hypothetical protein
MSDTGSGRILLVEHDAERRELLGEWLQVAGYDVLICPGPSSIRSECIGSETGRCALVGPASLIVLDLSFPDDGLPGRDVRVDLLGFYLMTEKPIVTIGRADGLIADRVDGPVTTFDHIPERRDLLATVGSLLVA